jgi:hypothetical protein
MIVNDFLFFYQLLRMQPGWATLFYPQFAGRYKYFLYPSPEAAPIPRGHEKHEPAGLRFMKFQSLDINRQGDSSAMPQPFLKPSVMGS